MNSPQVLELNDENFKEEVLENKQPVLVDFWRPGCGACLRIEQIMKELAKEFAGRAKVGKLNVFENSLTAKEYKIPAVPTLIIFKGGKPLEKAVGLRPKQILIDKLSALI